MGNRRVFGYWPTWSGTSATFHWDQLTDVAYFSTVLNTDGTLAASSWGTTGAQLVKDGHARNVRVHLTIERFNTGTNNEIHTFLSNPNAVSAGVTAIVQAVTGAGADGVNLDFEFVAGGDKAAYVSFVQALGQALHAAAPSAEVSIAMPAVAYPGYDVAALGQAADFLLIMAYDYHWTTSNPGPVAPLAPSMEWGGAAQSATIALYKAQVAPSKLVLGLPLYGYDYFATSNAVPGTRAPGTTAKAVLYKDAEVIAPTKGRLWDAASSTPYYLYQDMTGWRQCFYDDAESLGDKIDQVDAAGIAGIGLWALNYESDSFWKVLAAKSAAPDGGVDGGVDGGALLDAAGGALDLAGAAGDFSTGNDLATPPAQEHGACAIGAPRAGSGGFALLVAIAAIGAGRGRGGLRRRRPRACRTPGTAP